MFEVAEVGEKLSKKEFLALEPEIREALLDAQARLRDADVSIIIVIAGAEGAGKGESVNFLLEWLDARDVETHAMGLPTKEEIQRPSFFRFWERLPPHGRTAIFFGSWYTQPIVEKIQGKIDDNQFDGTMHKITEFERMLVGEKTLLLKFWLHITKKQQRKNFKNLEDNPDTAWRVTPDDWKLHKTYDKFIAVASRCLRQTSRGHAPWQIIEASDRRYRHMTIARSILESINKRLAAPPSPSREPEPLPTPAPKNIINSLDLSQLISRAEYNRQLKTLQGRLGRLSRQLTEANCSVVLVFEGSDAAGKGGCIRRITQALDARFYRIIPIASPTDEERARPYLWRFWRTLPGKGHMRIYDRSWYGRVLVERIEGLCRPEDWRRAFSEINQFEGELVDYGTLVIKFWLSISPEKQLERFKLREATGYKRYKITAEDWRNREKWPAYEAAACEMIERTSTELAPWNLVEAEDKHFARIKVLTIVCDCLQRRLDQRIGKGGRAKKKK